MCHNPDVQLIQAIGLKENLPAATRVFCLYLRAYSLSVSHFIEQEAELSILVHVLTQGSYYESRVECIHMDLLKQKLQPLF